MTTIILIRHAPVAMNKDRTASQWHLAPESRSACEKLAEQIRHYQPKHIYTSTEQKAIQTGQFIADKLKIETSISPHFHETERQSAYFYDNQANFRADVHEAMISPDKIVFGDEAFDAARERFKQQVQLLAEQKAHKTFAVVSHGRVLSMFLGELLNEPPVAIWEKLQMPAYAVLSWEAMQITKLVNSIEST